MEAYEESFEHFLVTIRTFYWLELLKFIQKTQKYKKAIRLLDIYNKDHLCQFS